MLKAPVMLLLNDEDVASLTEWTAALYEFIIARLKDRFHGVSDSVECRFRVILDDSVASSSEWYYVIGEITPAGDKRRGVTISFGECPKGFVIGPMKPRFWQRGANQIKFDSYESDAAFRAAVLDAMDKKLNWR